MERPAKYSPKERREAARRAAAMLRDCPAKHYDGRFSQATRGHDERLQRYVAGTPEVAAGIGRVVTGDGPAARFIDFTVDEAADGAFPYAKFHRSVVATFQIGWERMEAEEAAERVGGWREVYHELAARDETVKATNILIDEKILRKGVELGPEMTWYAVMVTLAAREAGVEDEAAVRDIALANTPLIAARARKNVTHTFYIDNYYNHIDCSAARLNGHGRLVLPYRFYREGDMDAPEPAGKTVGCVADLVKIADGDEFSALENCIFASINEMYELGLFNPQLAHETWRQCTELYERLDAETAELRRMGWTHTAIEQYTFGELCEIL